MAARLNGFCYRHLRGRHEAAEHPRGDAERRRAPGGAALRLDRRRRPLPDGPHRPRGGRRGRGGARRRTAAGDPTRWPPPASRPAVLRQKDGLALCSSSSVSAGAGTLALVRARRLLDTLQAAAALSMEGFRASLTPLDPRAIAARPAPGQEWAAAGLRALLAGGSLTQPGAARRLQDPHQLPLRLADPRLAACGARAAGGRGRPRGERLHRQPDGAHRRRPRDVNRQLPGPGGRARRRCRGARHRPGRLTGGRAHRPAEQRRAERPARAAHAALRGPRPAWRRCRSPPMRCSRRSAIAPPRSAFEHRHRLGRRGRLHQRRRGHAAALRVSSTSSPTSSRSSWCAPPRQWISQPRSGWETARGDV